eukprot:1156864-Pelagomonas_calceolata.AAC.4
MQLCSYAALMQHDTPARFVAPIPVVSVYFTSNSFAHLQATSSRTPPPFPLLALELMIKPPSHVSPLVEQVSQRIKARSNPPEGQAPNTSFSDSCA